MGGTKGSRGRKPKNEDQSEGQVSEELCQVKETDKPSKCAELPEFIGTRKIQGPQTSSNPNGAQGLRKSPRVQAHPAPPKPKRPRAPKRFKSPETEIIVPQHVKAMDLVVSTLLEQRRNLLDSTKEECDNALETIVRIWSAGNCKKFHREGETFASATARKRKMEMEKQNLKLQKSIKELTSKLNFWKLKAEELASRNQESENKAGELEANLEYWKSKADEMTQQKLDLENKAMDLEADLDYWKSKANELERGVFEEEEVTRDLEDSVELRSSNSNSDGGKSFTMGSSSSESFEKSYESFGSLVASLGESGSDELTVRISRGEDFRDVVVIDMASDLDYSSERSGNASPCSDAFDAGSDSNSSSVIIIESEDELGSKKGNPSNRPPQSSTGGKAALNRTPELERNRYRIKIATQLLDNCSLENELWTKEKIPKMTAKPPRRRKKKNWTKVKMHPSRKPKE